MKHVPNILTMLRIFLIPFFILIFLNNTFIAAVIFSIACITDVIDGYLARKYNVVSKFGMLFDPLADKLLQIFAMICLYQSNILPTFVVVVVIVKEVLMMSGALYLLFNNIVVPANKLGKFGTVVAAVTIIYLIAVGKNSIIPMPALYIIVIISTLGTLLGYIFVFLKKIEDNKTRNKA